MEFVALFSMLFRGRFGGIRPFFDRTDGPRDYPGTALKRILLLAIPIYHLSVKISSVCIYYLWLWNN